METSTKLTGENNPTQPPDAIGGNTAGGAVTPSSYISTLRHVCSRGLLCTCQHQTSDMKHPFPLRAAPHSGTRPRLSACPHLQVLQWRSGH